MNYSSDIQKPRALQQGKVNSSEERTRINKICRNRAGFLHGVISKKRKMPLPLSVLNTPPSIAIPVSQFITQRVGK